MLKESYSTIIFPLRKKDPSSVFTLYLAEFRIHSIETFADINLIFDHALRDYLANNIDEWALGSLCFSLSTDKKASKILKEGEDKLRTYILDCVDITWLAEGKNFPQYKEELEQYLKEFIKRSE